MPDFMINVLGCLVFAVVAYWARSNRHKDGFVIAAALSLLEALAALQMILLT